MQGGERRDKWTILAINEGQLEAELNMISNAQKDQADYRQNTVRGSCSRMSSMYRWF